tara:strand:- start:959 stop:1993 length:1035 start_codon:yes stop_codon:yes gene_type:complete
MIATIKISNKFIESIILEDFLNNRKIFEFLYELYKDEYVYLVGDKEHLIKLVKKHKTYLKKSGCVKQAKFIAALRNKVQWINTNIPIDLNLISNKEKNQNKFFFNFKQINRLSKKILKQISNIKDEAFRITLKRGQTYETTIRSQDVKKMQNKLLKIIFVVDEVIIYDKYIGTNLVFFHPKFKEIRRNNFLNDYGLTLNFLNQKIFKDSPTKPKCKIYTINKQDKLFFENPEKNYVTFKECAEEYINNAKGINCKLFLKKYRYKEKISEDFWKEAHDRSLVFKRDDHYIAYLNLDVGLDFIKKISHTLNKYTFTPGKKINYENLIEGDLTNIIKMDNDLELEVA